MRKTLNTGAKKQTRGHFPPKDIELVMSQTNCKESVAISALDAVNGDIVHAIMNISRTYKQK